MPMNPLEHVRLVRLVGRYPLRAMVLACGLTAMEGGCARDRTSSPVPGGVVVGGVHVSPDGWSGNDGTVERPLDLASALSAASKARPGDTIWLRGGTYKGSFSSRVTGAPDAPIVVRPLPGERVVIDTAPSKEPALAIYGAWTIFRDFEVMSSEPTRSSNTGIVVHGPHTKVVNMQVHDFTGGLALWRDALDSEAYGNIVFYNGWVDPADQKPKGHGIYTQNEAGTRRLTDNIIFSQFSAGIHAYGSSDAPLDNLDLEGNIIFNNGNPTGGHITNILIGGGRMARAPVLTSNYTYSSTPGDVNIGYSVGCERLRMKDNYFAQIGFAFQLVNCSGTIEGNTVYGDVRGIEGDSVVNRTAIQKHYPNNRYLPRPAAGVESFVRPNRYEPGRAHVVVFNWGKASNVTVDLAGAGLQRGTAFEMRDVQNLRAAPVISGTYSGASVTIPVSKLTETAPVVGLPTKLAHSAPEFVVLLVTPAATKPSWFRSMWSSVLGTFGV